LCDVAHLERLREDLALVIAGGRGKVGAAVVDDAIAVEMVGERTSSVTFTATTFAQLPAASSVKKSGTPSGAFTGAMSTP
jgi:hypothetical protein